ncbi:TPA: UvrD-helicase domain-containing protein [Mannheimia haemolytica]
MVERTIEPEVKKVFEAIKDGKNFILEGGAGSGKTYSLISIIENLSRDEPDKSIVCITYTNNAVAEIRSRISNDKLWVSTIHEFIWHIIGKFQTEIKECLVELINDTEQKKFLKPNSISDTELISLTHFEKMHIHYDEFYSMNPNENHQIKISHDHILILAEKMFSKYTKLCDILIDSANYIFIDEYQDTSPFVIKILLEHIQTRSKKNVLGFFGDTMQSIYDSGIGDLNAYELHKIQKTQNRRNPKKVIDLANKIRNDGLIQLPSNDTSAPNMDNGVLIPGTVKFIYGDKLEQLELLRKSLIYKSLEFNNNLKTKELRLTHKLNSEMAGFQKLFALYNSDLFLKLVTDLKNKFKENAIVHNKKKFIKIALESQLSFPKGKISLFDKIQSNPDYSAFYNEVKDWSFEDVVSKTNINKDSLLSYKFNALNNQYKSSKDRDEILKRLDFIYELIELYKDGRFNDFLRLTKFKIRSVRDKERLIKSMDTISDKSNNIDTVLKIALDNHLISKDDLFDNFIKNKGYYLWSRIKKLPFQEYINSIDYLKEYVSVITQHKVKGSEYDNVLVLLDNGQWSQYDFNTLFGEGSSNEKVQNRTKKLFYVTATRAKRNLIVYMPINNPKIIEKARIFFENEDIHNVTTLSDI